MANAADVEKGYSTNGNTEHLHEGMDRENALNRIKTAGSISISPELFEKIYLSPQNKVKGQLRLTLGNPTPICLIGFLLALTPLCCDLLGWRGSGGNGFAFIGAYYGFGSILMLIGAIFELILGNTFPAVTFASFSAFWFTFASTLVPSFDAYSTYPDGGIQSAEWANSFAFFLLWMGFMCVIYLICALRTNMVFCTIFFTLICAFSCLAGEYWALGEGQAAAAAKLQTAAGSFLFVTSCAGWWIFAAQMFASVDFPLSLPVGDLSGMIKGASARGKVE